METRIRPARREDCRNLAALAIQVWLHTYATTGIRDALSNHVLEEYTPERFLRLLDDPDHLLLAAEADGHLIGFADLHFDSPWPEVPGTRAELATLYVQEPFHGRGVGTGLMAAAREQAAQRSGSSALWLSVYHGNARAIHFYEKSGFVRAGAFDFEFGGEKHRNHVLACPGS